MSYKEGITLFAVLGLYTQFKPAVAKEIVKAFQTPDKLRIKILHVRMVTCVKIALNS